MTASTSRESRESAPRAFDANDLCVVAACHTFLCAVPTQCVHRLVLPGDVDHASSEGQSVAGRLGMVTVSGEPFAAWDLGALLSMGSLDAAWILMRIEHAGDHVPIALRTGPCIAVQELAAHPLPHARSRARSPRGPPKGARRASSSV
jgi:hypothetical protein